MAQKVVYWFLIALIMSLSFGQLLRFEFFSIPVYIHDILVISILFLHGLTCDWRTVLKRNSWLQAKKGSTAVERTVLYGTRIFLLALLLSSTRALTLYPLASLLIPSLYMFRLLTYLLLFFVIKQSKVSIPIEYFYISGLVTVSIGLLQYFLLPDMRVFQYLGWDDHLSRLTLPHFDPTFTGVMISLSLLTFPPTRSSILYPAFSLLAILLTYSRSVWISLGLTFTYFMLKSKKLNFLIIGICLLLIPISFLPKRFGEGTNLLRTYSISSRLESDISYIQKYKWDLLIGHGMNTLILDTEDSQYSNHATGPNNSYLYLLTTTGLLGLVGWGIFMFSLYSKSTYKPMLIFFFIASLFNNIMFYPFALLWVLLLESMVPTLA